MTITPLVSSLVQRMQGTAPVFLVGLSCSDLCVCDVNTSDLDFAQENTNSLMHLHALKKDHMHSEHAASKRSRAQVLPYRRGLCLFQLLCMSSTSACASVCERVRHAQVVLSVPVCTDGNTCTFLLSELRVCRFSSSAVVVISTLTTQIPRPVMCAYKSLFTCKKS